MIVYLIVNIVNGKKYVGKTSKSLDERWRVHVQHTCESHYRNQLITKAIRKYGIESFSRSVIEECRDDDHASEREVFWIEALRTQDRTIGYNMTSGGEGTPGRAVSEETRRRLSERVVSDETRKKLSQEMRRRLENETLTQRSARIDAQRKAISGEKNPFYGKSWGRRGPHSDETKKKLSESHAGKSLTESHKERIRTSVSKIDAKILGSNRGMCWPVEAYDPSGFLVMVYEGFKQAAESLGIDIRAARKFSKLNVPVGSLTLIKGKRTSRKDVKEMKKSLQAKPVEDLR